MKSRAHTSMRRHDSGEALLEMALVLPILLVLSMGMLDFGRAFHAKSVLDQAAREGARVGVVTVPFGDAPAIARANAVLAAAGLSPSTPTTAVLDPNTKLVTVTVKTDFDFVTPGLFALVGGLTGTKSNGTAIGMTGKSTMRLEDGT